MFENLGKFSEMFSKMGDFKKQMEELQKRIANIRVTANAGAGMVEATATGDGKISSIKINKNLFEADDLVMLEDLTIAAVNEALNKAKEASAYEMKNLTGLNMEQFKSMFGGNAPGGGD